MIYNQRHPIALYSQPDRRGALHNKFDLTQINIHDMSYLSHPGPNLVSLSTLIALFHSLAKRLPDIFLNLIREIGIGIQRSVKPL